MVLFWERVLYIYMCRLYIDVQVRVIIYVIVKHNIILISSKSMRLIAKFAWIIDLWMLEIKCTQLVNLIKNYTPSNYMLNTIMYTHFVSNICYQCIVLLKIIKWMIINANTYVWQFNIFFLNFKLGNTKLLSNDWVSHRFSMNILIQYDTYAMTHSWSMKCVLFWREACQS